jgi:hypothetical protein
MSHALRDHAAWLQNECRKFTNKWRQAHSRHANDTPPPPDIMPPKLTKFQRKVADIIGMMGGGIENVPINWEKASWDWAKDPNKGFACVYQNTLATWDFNQLTLLVFLCHEARIRCEITGHAANMIKLSFLSRASRGDMKTAHPNLDEAVKWFKERYLPADHRIIYREPKK